MERNKRLEETSKNPKIFKEEEEKTWITCIEKSQQTIGQFPKPLRDNPFYKIQALFKFVLENNEKNQEKIIKKKQYEIGLLIVEHLKSFIEYDVKRKEYEYRETKASIIRNIW